MEATTKLEKRSLQVQRGAARASVLGVNDGLVSILCLVLGMAGAGAASGDVVLAGFAGLIAGAVSMAAGEWISLKSQVDLYKGILADIKHALQTSKAPLVDQLTQAFVRVGQDEQPARRVAETLSQDEHRFTEVYAQQVMGFNPKELGSPWIAAGLSFALFTAGSLAPLLPWFFGERDISLIVSILLTLLGGVIVGGYISASSGGSIIKGGLRQVAVIVFASAVTYGIGYIFGVTVA